MAATVQAGESSPAVAQLKLDDLALKTQVSFGSLLLSSDDEDTVEAMSTPILKLGTPIPIPDVVDVTGVALELNTQPSITVHHQSPVCAAPAVRPQISSEGTAPLPAMSRQATFEPESTPSSTAPQTMRQVTSEPEQAAVPVLSLKKHSSDSSSGALSTHVPGSPSLFRQTTFEPESHSATTATVHVTASPMMCRQSTFEPAQSDVSTPTMCRQSTFEPAQSDVSTPLMCRQSTFEPENDTVTSESLPAQTPVMQHQTTFDPESAPATEGAPQWVLRLHGYPVSP